VGRELSVHNACSMLLSIEVARCSQIGKYCQKLLFSEKNFPTFLGNIFEAKILSLFEIPIVSIDKIINFRLFVKWIPNFRKKVQLNICRCVSSASAPDNIPEYVHLCLKSYFNHCSVRIHSQPILTVY